jgi:Na+-translocating ferredoxin:NAD+ oxidoreductase RnfG subunit
MLKTAILILLICLFAEPLLAGSDIEYNNRSLKRELAKAEIKDFNELEEIALPDSLKAAGNIEGKYFVLRNNSQYKYVYVGRVNSCRAGGCSITNNIHTHGSSEYFDYYIIYDARKTVKKVKVYNYQATHGHEITAKGWLRQFVGHKASGTLQVDKNIDSISGATISVYAITNDIQRKTMLLKNIAEL